MPHRPKLWIHRTRRFWVGLGVLLFLLALYFLSGEGLLGFTAIRSATPTAPEIELELELGSGGLLISKDEDRVSSLHRHPISRGWDFDYYFIHIGFGTFWTPEWDHHRGEWSLFLPLWPLPVLWAVIWITRMVRAERRELKKWSGSLQEP